MFSLKFSLFSADKVVKVWNPELSGKLMFNLNSSIQALAFNPITKTLAVGTENSICLWNEGSQSVGKVDVEGRVTSIAFVILN